MIILGLDGATLSLLRPWAEAGELPTFERLFDESVHGDLESTEPPVTIPAWLTFATSRTPEDLDMYGFTHFNRETRELELTHDEYVSGKLWDVVRDQGGRSVVFNIPGSYPWQEIDGTIVAAAPEYKESYAYPEERWDELVDLVDGYKLRIDAESGTDEYVEQGLDLVEKRFTAFEHFIQKENPDLAVGLIRATDRIAHHYWDEEMSKDNDLLDVYRAVDRRLGEFLERHEDENVVVMSDHGFEAIDSYFAVNYVLEQRGFTTLIESGDHGRAALGKLRVGARRVLSKLDLLTFVRRHVPEETVRSIPSGTTLGLDNAISLGRIDWDETVAVADSGGKTALVYVFEDDEPERERLLGDVEDALRDAASEARIEVTFTRTARGGVHTPDLKMTIRTSGVYTSSRFDVDGSVFHEDSSGHAINGIFFARGPDFRDGELKGAHLIDVAPTVLHGLGMDIPEYMSGEVLNVYDPESAPARNERSRYEFVGGDAIAEGGVSGDEERETEVKDRLRDLGYID
jgi:predicted AlkP superfamily phosphohydrolase/phosphomutase